MECTVMVMLCVFFFSSRRRHTRCALVTGVQTCALPICSARDENGWTLQAGALVIELPGDAHEIETLVELCPQANTRLMGLYASSGLLCTQCEAEGFRRITFFPDRPDVLSIDRKSTSLKSSH